MKLVSVAAAVFVVACGGSHPHTPSDAPGSDASADAGDMDAMLPADSWISVAPATQHTCAIRSDRSLYCWGGNQFGELGDGTTTERDAPERVGTDSWLAIASGIDFACGIETDHTLWCWGYDKGGDLGTPVPPLPYIIATPSPIAGSWSAIETGDGFACGLRDDATLWCWGVYYPVPGTSITPTQIGSTTWRAISVGDSHLCGVQMDGSLWCWGTNTYGQSGPATSQTPSQIGTDVWQQVSAGATSTCAITAAGQLRCWGDNRDGELAAATPAMTGTPTPVLLAGQDLTDWTEVSVGGHYACARRADGTAWCWGANRRGQLTQPTSVSNATPTQVDGTWLSIAAGVQHTCAIAADHSLWCVGSDGTGELGDGGTSRRSPIEISGSWSDVALESATMCALDTSGIPSCVGQGNSGALGTGGTSSSLTPDARQLTHVIATGTPWRALGGRAMTGCGIASDRSLWCWGERSTGAIPEESATPLHVGTDTWTAVAPGLHGCAIDTASALYCWGSMNYWGEDGCAGSHTPAQIGTDTTWTSITTGTYQSCGVNAAGTFCWGANYWAQLGNGTTSNSARSCTPTAVAGNHPFVSIAAGADHACGLLADGHAYCWGHNVAGQVGDGTTADDASPVSIGNQTWRQIAGGALFTCGVGLDGSLWCWGDNSRGQLADGTYASHPVPMRVGTDTDWKKVSLGDYFACALKTDQSLWCWGANDYAQLGDGTGWREQLVRVP